MPAHCTPCVLHQRLRVRLDGHFCTVHAVADMLRLLDGHFCAVHAVADMLGSVWLTYPWHCSQARSARLKQLMLTIEVSMPQAKNILIILLLVFYIFGIAGMKLYGGVCTEPGAPSAVLSGFNYRRCKYLNRHDNFDSISSSMVGAVHPTPHAYMHA